MSKPGRIVDQIDSSTRLLPEFQRGYAQPEIDSEIADPETGFEGRG